jgi:hypothetical protein
MAKCNHKHIKKVGNHSTEIPCYYIAGICVVNPIHQGTMEMFLRSTYPYHHGRTYEESKIATQSLVPNNIVFANINLW